MNFERATNGEQKLGPAAMFISKIYASLHSKMVTIPAAIVRDLLLFSFDERIKTRHKELQKLSETDIIKFVTILARSKAGIAATDIQKLAAETNLDKKEVENILKLVKEGVEFTLARGGLSKLFVVDALEESKTSIGTVGKPGYNDIVEGVSLVQSLYAMFVESASVDSIAANYTTRMSTNKAIQLIQQLLVVFTAPSGSSTQARLSYVVSEIMSYLKAGELIKTREDIPGVLYEITDVPFVSEGLNFGDVLLAHLATIRTIQGLKPIGASSSMNVTDLIDEFIFGKGDLIPFIPAGYVKPNAQTSMLLIENLWLMFAINRVVTSNYGSTASRIDSVVDARKYKRNDNYDKSIVEGIRASSILLDSFYDVSSYLKTLVQDTTVYFQDVHPIIREKLAKFHFDWLGKYNSAQLPYEHPRALFEAATCINHDYNVSLTFSSTPVKYLVTDADRKSGISFISNPDTLAFSTALRSGSLKGSLSALGETFKLKKLFGVTPQMENFYCIELPEPQFFTSNPAFKIVYSIQEIYELITKCPLVEELRKRGDTEFIVSAQDAMYKLNVPYEKAKDLIKTGPTTYLTFQNYKQTLFYWKGETAGVYEYAGGSESRFIEPFVSAFPTFITTDLVENQVEIIRLFDPKMQTKDIDAMDMNLKKVEEELKLQKEKNQALEDEMAKLKK